MIVKLPLKYRVLEVLLDASEKSASRFVPNSESIIGAAFPEISGSALLSILADLRADKLINYMLTYGGGVEGLMISQRARSVLIGVREEQKRKDDEKLDARRWQIKSMIIGYSLGFISGVGVMIVRELLFK